MNKILLTTRPKHDYTTHYLFYWASEIIKLARDKGVSVLDLKKKRANRKEFESMLSKKEPLLVFLNGHGNADCVAGHDDEILLEAGKNEELLEMKIIYALSCKSAKELGPKSVGSGALSYVGYDNDFVFLWEEGKISKPLEDKTAQLFLEPSNCVVGSLLKGHTVGEACRKSKQLFLKNIHELLTSENSSEIVPYLMWDMRHQVCLGDRSSSF